MPIRQASGRRTVRLTKKTTIINDYLRGGPDSMTSLEEVVTIFKHYLPTAAGKQSQNPAAAEPSNNNGVAFLQPWTEVGSRTDSRAYYACGGFGHLIRDCKKTKHEGKVAIFKKGDATWRASSGGRSTAPQTPPQQTTTSNNNKKTAAVNPDTGFINVNTAGDDISLLLQASFAQFTR